MGQSAHSTVNFPKTLKVMVLNAENLFLFLDRWDGTPITEMTEHKWQLASSSLLDNKSLQKLREMSSLIKQHAPDLIMLTEVGGLESLENFNQYFLEQRYQAFLMEGNSDRGIDMGFLLAATWPGEAKIISHRDHLLPHPTYKKFSRDVLRLTLSYQGQEWLHAWLVHLKSKLDMKKEDFEGRTRRAVEVMALAHLMKKSDNLVPSFLGGDFNGNAVDPDREPEFDPLYHLANLTDVAQLAALPLEERFSYIHFQRSGLRVMQQLDYLFLNNAAQKMLIPNSVGFPRWHNLQFGPLPVPVRPEQKRLLPSDHYPVVAEFDLTQHPLAPSVFSC